MILELLNLGGYGQFVWPSFMFTFILCTVFYFKTKKLLQKQEKIFLKENKYINTLDEKNFEEKKNTKEVLSGSSI